MPAPVDAFDELAALFLTHPERTAEHGTPPPQRQVEVLVVGHLPVRGSLWIGPYADAIARERGPTALLRLNEDEPSIELFRAASPRTEVADGDVLNAIDRLTQRIATWIIRPPSPQSAPAETGGTATANAWQAADRVTILTGADEAATVSLYQMLKECAESTRSAGRSMPCVQLGVVGCERERAMELVQRINRTASAFLNVQVALAACLPYMDAGIRSNGYHRFSAADAPSLLDVLGRLRSPMRPSTHSTDPRNGQARTESPLDERNWSDTSCIALAAAAEEELDRFGTSAFAAHPPSPRENGAGVDTQHAASASVVPAKVSPKPTPPMMELPVTAPGRAGVPRLDEGDPLPLVQHVAGLTALPFRCPDCPTIELAVDPDRRIHALGRETELRRMHTVAAWLRRHHDLLVRACPGVALDGGGCIQHLFTDTPASLADLHGSDLRLHVLAPVRIGGQTAWYTAPLSKA
jgi:hypothetical protein